MRLLKLAAAFVAPFILTLVFATSGHAYMHVDWGCVGGMTQGHSSADGWWYGKTGYGGVQSNRQFYGNALGQSLNMTADDAASRWGGWGAYWSGASVNGNYTRYGNEDLLCEIAHRSNYDNKWTIWDVRINGYDDGLHGVVRSMRVVRERNFVGFTPVSMQTVNWDACANDPYC